MSTLNEIRSDPVDQAVALSETQRTVRDRVREALQGKADPDVAWAIDGLEKRMSLAGQENPTRWPIRSQEGRQAVADVLVAWVLKQAAARRRDFEAGGLAAAGVEAKRQIRRHEGLPSDGWDVDPFGVVVLLEDPGQDPQDVMEATLFLARAANDQQIAQAADGDLHPFVQERVGSLAPRQYYEDLASLIVETGDVGCDLICRVLESEDFCKKMHPLVHLISLTTARS